jgi:organic hydroperoxide reductase OsmC/OhrA
MHDLPHHYPVSASATATSNVDVTSPGLDALDTAPPAEFGGPGDRWSPETLLVASVANCFIFTFRAVARGSRLDWTSLRCDVDGVLDRVDRVLQFTEYRIRVRLIVPQGSDEKKAARLLEKAEHGCLITNSLTGECHLDAEVSSA